MPFPVLLDEDGDAAEIVGTGTLGAASLLRPDAIAAGVGSFLKGNRQKNAGRRPMQLGATIVIGPGDEILYEDYEDYAGDHADIDEVIQALQA